MRNIFIIFIASLFFILISSVAYAQVTGTTNAATGKTTTTATLNATITSYGSAGGANPIQFEYTLNSDVAWASSTIINAVPASGSEDGLDPWLFTLNITGLTLGTEYKYRLIGEDWDLTPFQFAEQTFTTLSAASIPSLTTNSINPTDQSSIFTGGNVTNDGGAAVTARGIVYRSITPVNITTNDGNISAGSGTGTFSATVSSLAANTTYYVRAYATNSVGTGYGLPRQVKTAPAIPAANAATNVSSTTLSCNWASSVGATTYFLDVATTNTFDAGTFLTGFENRDVSNVITYNVSGLSAASYYYYRVRSNNGNSSQSSNVVTVLTAPSPTIANAATNITSAGFQANWDFVPGATSYKLDVSSMPDFSSGNVLTNQNVTNTYYNVGGLTSGQTYYFRVRTSNGNSSSNSNIKQVILFCAAPVALPASDLLPTSFTANWNTVTGADSYRLDVSESSSFSSFVGGYQDRVLGSVSSESVTGLVNGLTYYYRIRAVGGAGASPSSNTMAVIKAPIANPASDTLNTSFVASWNSVAGAAGYKLIVDNDADFLSPVSGYNDLDVGNFITKNVSALTPNTTYYYKVKAYTTGGESSYSNVISLTTLVDPPAAPVASAASAILSNGFTAQWSASVGADGYYLDVASNLAFTVFVSGFQGLNVSNVTNYAVSGLNSNTNYYYRVRAYNAGGSSANSNGITVVTGPETPSASAATNVSHSSFTANWNTSTGATSYIIDVATNLGFSSYVSGFQNLDVGNVSNYNVTGLSGGTNYYYRIRAYNGTSSSTNSNSITVLTLCEAPSATAATLTNTNSFQANWNSATGAASYRIDVSMQSGFGTFVSGYQDLTVLGTNVSVTGLASNTTYYYRVRAVNTSGTSAQSNSITVFTAGASISNWTGSASNVWTNTANWSDGLPSSATDVIILASASTMPVITTSVECKNLTIQANASLTVSPAGNLTVNGNLTCKADSGLSNPMGSLIDYGTLTVTGTKRFERNITASRWHVFASPFASSTVGNFNPKIAGVNIREYFETTDLWNYLTGASSFTPTVGYSLYMTSDRVMNLSASSSLNSGFKSVPLTFTDLKGYGWNQVGNPYPSAIDWNSSSGWTKNNVNNTVYLWNGTVYATFNGTVGTNGGSRYIPPMQGFYVKATAAGTLAMDNSVRVHNSQTYFKKSEQDNLSDLLRISSSNGKFSDEIAILFNADATDGYDMHFDADKLFSSFDSVPEIYSFVDNNILSINTMSAISDNLTIPLGIKVQHAGDFQLSFSNIESFGSQVGIYLNDNQSGDVIDLRNQSVYHYSSLAEDNKTRFSVMFSPDILNVDELKNQGISIYSAGDEIFIRKFSHSTEQGKIYVYDLSGKIIHTRNSNASVESFKLDANSGAYIVKYIGGAKNVTQKLFVHHTK